MNKSKNGDGSIKNCAIKLTFFVWVRPFLQMYVSSNEENNFIS